jgi:uncharacterized delta-60 repeat protein
MAPPNSLPLSGVATICALLGILAAPAPLAQGAPGDLDRDFGAGGRLTATVGLRSASVPAGAAVLQADGRLLIGGPGGVSYGGFGPSRPVPIVARYLANGSLDPSFGEGGIATLPMLSRVYDLAITGSGDIVVAGGSEDASGFDALVVRLSPGGSVDPDFGAGGTATLAGFSISVDSVAIQPDGRIIAGETYGGLARLNSDGTLDQSFGNGGYLASAPPAKEVAIQADGGIVAGGTTSRSCGRLCSESGIVIGRFDSNGTPDQTFGSGGSFVRFGSAFEGLELTPDGGVLFFGQGSNVLHRLDAAGSIDTGFGDAGRVTLSEGAFAAVSVLADGMILAAASLFGPVSGPPSALLRYGPDGTPDPGFGGGDGHAPGPSMHVRDVAIEAAGGVLVAGTVVECGSHMFTGFSVTCTSHFALARADSGGAADGSFAGGQGVAVTRVLEASSDLSQAVIRQPDGQVLLAGTTDAGGEDGVGDTNFALMRLAADGGRDPTFGPGGSGVVVTDLQAASDDRATALLRRANGEIVAVGTSNDGFGMVGYRPDGSPDPGFGRDGVVTIPGGAGLLGPVSSVDAALQPDGKILVAADYALARFETDGSLDRSFGGDGMITPAFRVRALVLRPEGGFLVAGGDELGGGTNTALARYTSAGELDPGFGEGGIAMTSFGEYDIAEAIAVQDDGKIVLAGTARPDRVSSGTAFALSRFRPSGEIDPSFGGDGRAVVGFGDHRFDAATAVVMDGARIIAAGSTAQQSYPTTGDSFALARVNPDGRLDPSFGSGDGRVETTFAAGRSAAMAAIADRGLLVAGSVNGCTFGPECEGDLALAAYELGGPPLVGCAGGFATVLGTPGEDDLFGTPGSDVIVGLGGADSISAGTGQDLICAGDGEDLIAAGDAGDTIRAGHGSDQVRAEGGSDHVAAGPGDDFVTGSAGRDVVFGAAGADRLLGGAGNDRLFGAVGPDRLLGGDGRDFLRGGPGKDRVRGGSGRDDSGG